ncbi:MAG: ABC transporter substrate-binding protein, partial [Solobacterium sp.]|nr:ABC transporter substrate-binding protein [Solobacterium sp.]
LTAASGEYDTTLQSELGKSSAPTMFQIGNAGAVATYGDYALDLRGTDVYNEMTTHSFDQVGEDGYTYSIGYCYESYGIIVNKDLLAKAGYSVADIKDFASLKAVAEDIHARSAELGFDAFTNAGLDGSSSWRFSGHLLGVALYYQFRDAGKSMSVPEATITDAYMNTELRNIWDLYLNNSTTDPVANNTATGDAAEAEMKEGKAVFYQNGTWEYDALSGALGAENIQMIPIYMGVAGEEKAGLASGTENCWAVNKNASEADQKATLDFMKWVVTSEEGTTMMAEQFGPIPFKSAKTPANVFFADANALLAAGNYNVDWAFNATPNVDEFRAGVVSALQAYGKEQTDDNWAKVVSAIVDGWAVQYAATH